MARRERGQKVLLAVAYARRSTDRQEQSIADQKRAIERYAGTNEYEIIDWYVDDAISGAWTVQRKAFLKMIEDARREDCPFSHILVYDVKRFGRLDNDETGHYWYLLAQAGVEVAYVSENFNGDDTDDLLRPLKQWQARQELKDLSKVTVRGMLSKGEGGWWLGGTPPYGYDLAYHDAHGNFLMVARFMPDWTKQILDEHGKLQRTLGAGDRPMVSKADRAKLVLSSQDRVEVIRKIFSWYTADGLGYKSIADRLNAEGIPSPRGGAGGRHKWSMTSVREIISNPVYAGDAVWNRRSMSKFNRIEDGRAVAKQTTRARTVQENDEENWIVTRDVHPAVISRQVWAKAKRRRTERRERYGQNYRRGRGARSDYLLSGMMVCESCGHHWQGHAVGKGKRRKDGTQVRTKYYECGSYMTKGNSVCQRNVIQKDVMEGMVLDEIGKTLRRFLAGDDGRQGLRAVLDEVLAREGAPDMQGELERLRKRRAELDAKIDNILDNITVENRECANRRIRELRGALREIEPRLEELEAASGAEADLEALTDVMLDYMAEFEKVAAQGTVDEKRRFIRAFTKGIELDPRSGKGRAQFFPLPDFAALSGFQPAAAKSSFSMVAGARYVVEKKIPARIIDFEFAKESIQMSKQVRTSPFWTLLVA